MMRNKDDRERNRTGLSGMQWLGIALMIVGAAVAAVGAFSAWRSSEKFESLYESRYESMIEEGLDSDSADSWANYTTRISSAAAVPIIVIGGILMLAGLPCFFAAYSDKGYELRRSTKEDAEEYSRLKDDEFDYPDDDYDYILDDDVRKRLIKERDKKIKEKLKRQKKLSRKKG